MTKEVLLDTCAWLLSSGDPRITDNRIIIATAIEHKLPLVTGD